MKYTIYRNIVEKNALYTMNFRLKKMAGSTPRSALLSKRHPKLAIFFCIRTDIPEGTVFALLSRSSQTRPTGLIRMISRETLVYV